MPDNLLLMMLGTPAAIARPQVGSAINSIIAVSYLSGLGESGRVITDPNELYKFAGPIRLKFSSIQIT